MSRGVLDQAGLGAIPAGILDEFNRAVEIARRAPLPDVAELTTDVFV